MKGIECCDCREGMRRLSDNVIDLTVSSSPYNLMRLYGGHRYGFDVFKDIARQLTRVTKAGGVICWVVANQIMGMRETLQVEREKLFFCDECGLWPYQHLIATGMGDLPVGSKVTQRYAAQMTHHVLVLSKGRPSYSHCLRDKRNHGAGQRGGNRMFHNRDGSIRVAKLKGVIGPYGRRTNVWFYHSAGVNGNGHPSVTNPRLVRDLIWSYSQPGELVFDPMAGSGTTLVQAILNDRDYLGFEIHQPYVEIIRRNVQRAEAEQLRKVIERLTRHQHRTA